MEGGWLGRGGKGRGAIGGGVGKGEWSILSQGVPTHSYATRPTRRRRRGGWLRALSRGAEWRVGEAFVCVCGGGGGEGEREEGGEGRRGLPGSCCPRAPSRAHLSQGCPEHPVHRGAFLHERCSHLSASTVRCGTRDGWRHRFAVGFR